MAGTNFVACFEAVVYRNEYWYTDGTRGNLVSFHCHAIVWMGSLSGLRRLKQRIEGRFKPILSDSGVQVSKMKSVASALAYMAKLPVLGKRTVRKRSGKIGQEDTTISYRSRRNLFHAFKDYGTFDLWLGGKDGARALRSARQSAKDKLSRIEV